MSEVANTGEVWFGRLFIYTPEGILSDLIPLLRESSLFRKHLSSYGFDNLVDLFSL
jgi:hypothetical protein